MLFIITTMLIFWLSGCAISDWRSRRLPNILALGAYLPAIASLVVLQQSLLGTSVSSALLAWLAALVLTVPAYIVRWLGAGDVKMLSAMALIGGLPFMLGGYAIAAFITIAMLLFWQFFSRVIPYFNLQLTRYGWSVPAMLPLKGKMLPFGTSLGLGGVIYLLMTYSG